MRANSMKKPPSKGAPTQPDYINSGGGFARRPKTLTCSICGREFGTQSLEIHQKTCIQKYQNQLSNLPNEHRRNMPSVQQMKQKVEQEKQYRQHRPQSGNDALRGKGYYDIGAQPSVSMALVPCRRCGRRFNPDRIMKHESVCIGPEPDVARIKQQQIDQNKKAARYLRPKQTGKWRQQHLEFQGALKEMRRQKASGYGGGYGAQRSSNRGGYQQKQQYGYPPQSSKQVQYYDDQRYTKSTVVNSRKQPQQHMRTPPHQQKQPQQISNSQYSQPKQVRASSSKPVQKNYSGGFNNQKPTYGRDLPPNFGGGGSIANSNVSTFSLFTGDGRPPDYSAYQRSNPYAKKNGLY